MKKLTPTFMESDNNQTPEIPVEELPDELKGRYGIEEGDVDYDGLDRDGKRPLFELWIQRQPHLPSKQEATQQITTQVRDAAHNALQVISMEEMEVFDMGSHVVDGCDPKQMVELMNRSYRLPELPYWNANGLFTMEEAGAALEVQGNNDTERREYIERLRSSGEEVIGVRVKVKTSRGVERVWLVAEIDPNLLN